VTRLFASVALGLAVLVSPAISRERDPQLGCTISTSGLSFGAYSTFSAAPLASTATVNYQCALAILVRVELSTGSAGGFAPRRMTSGASTLDYNLFLDAGYSTIWGNGSAGTGRLSHIVVALFPHVATVYGRAPGLQDVPAGTYSDTVTASIIW
jgi:spore coat protein U-like protein